MGMAVADILSDSIKQLLLFVEAQLITLETEMIFSMLDWTQSLSPLRMGT